MQYVNHFILKWFVEAFFQIALFSLLLALAPWLSIELADWSLEQDPWPALAALVPWVLACFLSWPLLLSAAGKVVAIAILWVETNIADDSTGPQTLAMRRRVAARIIYMWLCGLLLWMVLLLCVIGPPWFAYPLLLPGAAGAIRRIRRSFQSFYAVCERPLAT